MSLTKVHAALEAQANSALSGWSIARENAPFAPPANTKWAAVFFLPNIPSVDTLSSTGEDMVDGVYQIDLNYPLWTGDSTARTDFGTVRGYFKAGQKLTSSGQSVVISNCGRSEGRRIDKEAWRVTVSVYWYAMIPR